MNKASFLKCSLKMVVSVEDFFSVSGSCLPEFKSSTSKYLHYFFLTLRQMASVGVSTLNSRIDLNKPNTWLF